MATAACSTTRHPVRASFWFRSNRVRRSPIHASPSSIWRPPALHRPAPTRSWRCRRRPGPLLGTPLPFEPGHIAVSDDGSTLYVNGWAPDPHVARLNLSTHAIEIVFSLPKSPTSGGQYQPQDIAVIPGSPHAAVVSMVDNVVFQSGLAAFDDTNMRPQLQAELGQAEDHRSPGRCRHVLRVGHRWCLHGLHRERAGRRSADGRCTAR